MLSFDVRADPVGVEQKSPSWCVERIITMAREIKTTLPGIRSFVHLTAEEALKKYGGGFSLVGRPLTPPAPAGAQSPRVSGNPSRRGAARTDGRGQVLGGQPQRAGAAVAAKPVQKKGKKSNG